jgi:putative ABC transport system substrate-binding protein
MTRRSLLFTAVVVLLANTNAIAERPAKVGFLAPAGREHVDKPLWQTLTELGWIEGRNLVVERRAVGGGGQTFPAAAGELLRLNPDVIVAVAAGAMAAKRATSSIPIVFVEVGQPVKLGLVNSFARPGGNATGISSLNSDLVAKRLELLRAVVPKLSAVAAVACCVGMQDPLFEGYLEDTLAAARPLKITVHPLRLKNYDDAEGLFGAIVAQRAEAVIFLPNAQLMGVRGRLIEIAIRHRLPTIFDSRFYAESGGLIAYGIDRDEAYRRAASFVDRILKGAKPADIPVEQPTKLRLVLNLRTAKTLGLVIPPSVRLRADEVIE